MKFHLDNATDIAGFSAESVSKGTNVKVKTRGALTSDDPEFYRYTDQISNIYLAKCGIPSNWVITFLIVVHADSNTDVFVNDFPVNIRIKAKRPIEKGEVVMEKDVADIRAVEFPEIQILPTDKVIYCFKVGWRFGLFFDCSYHAKLPESEPPLLQQELDVKRMGEDLGGLYRYLTFYHLYKTLESGTCFEDMLKDGWFPFLEMLPREYKMLSEHYEAKLNVDAKVAETVALFTNTRIETMMKRWWSSPLFTGKQKIIEAGVAAHLQGTAAGYILCIKTLASEIEGILRALYQVETGKGDGVKVAEFIQHIIDKGKQTTGSEFSLLLPTPFLEYLRKVTFGSFSTTTGNVEISRHSVGHGVAGQDKYTRERALQFILTLDQIFFYCM